MPTPQEGRPAKKLDSGRPESLSVRAEPGRSTGSEFRVLSSAHADGGFKVRSAPQCGELFRARHLVASAIIITKEEGTEMKKGLLALAMVGLLGAFGVGCGTVCDDAADICPAASGSASGSASASSSKEAECTGQAECIAQCVVDADSCKFEADSAEAKCAADCK